MSKVAIVTDSTAYLPEELTAEYGISVIPLAVIWGDDNLLDNVDIKADQFYKKLSKTDVMPSTSQPTIQAFLDKYTKLHHDGYDILTVVISAELSGTMDSALQAKKMIPEANIIVINSQTTSLPLAFMVLAAARAAKRGASLEKCEEIVETIREHTQVFFAVDTLEFLHRGGRIGGAARFLGTALGLKPILYLKDGKVEALEKVRSSKRAHQRLVELVEAGIDGKTPTNVIGVVHASTEDAATGLLKLAKRKFKPDEVFMTSISPVLGTHTGPGAIGMAYVAGVDPGLLTD